MAVPIDSTRSTLFSSSFVLDLFRIGGFFSLSTLRVLSLFIHVALDSAYVKFTSAIFMNALKLSSSRVYCSRTRSHERSQLISPLCFVASLRVAVGNEREEPD